MGCEQLERTKPCLEMKVILIPSYTNKQQCFFDMFMAKYFRCQACLLNIDITFLAQLANIT